MSGSTNVGLIGKKYQTEGIFKIKQFTTSCSSTLCRGGGRNFRGGYFRAWANESYGFPQFVSMEFTENATIGPLPVIKLTTWNSGIFIIGPFPVIKTSQQDSYTINN